MVHTSHAPSVGEPADRGRALPHELRVREREMAVTMDIGRASCHWILTLLSCLLLLNAELVLSQSTSCGGNISIDSMVIRTNTSSLVFDMSCTVPSELVLPNITASTWRWNKLAADNTVEEVLTNITNASTDFSRYMLDVQCSRGDIYESIYTGPSGACLHICLFLVEIEEVRPTVILNSFNGRYPVANITEGNLLSDQTTDPDMSLLAGNRTEVPVGTCSSIFFTGLGGCRLEVGGVWYKDRQFLDVQSDANYQVSSSGELRIVSLSEMAAGVYVCVTSLPMGLGAFITTNVRISIQQTMIPTNAPMTMTTEPATTTLPLINSVLPAWAVGIIVANVIVVILVGFVILGIVCFLVRRGQPLKRIDEESVKLRPLSMTERSPRPVSMAEQIQLMEEETEEVDFVGPAEVPFSAILFEELLHKGTFKVVHHGVVNCPEQGIMSHPVAVKRLKDDNSELGMEELMGEADTLRAVQNKAGTHPNVVSLVGMITQGGPTCLLLEFVPHGRLDDFLLALKDGPVPEWYIRFVKSSSYKVPYHKQVSGDLMRVLLQVAEGMKFLTDHGFIHRDLSTRTVLIGDRMNVKVSDPGMTHEGYYYVVTEREHYLQDMAPECLWEKRYSVWSDVWSFGILAYKVIAMETVPFPDATVSDIYDKMMGGERPQTLASFSNEMFFLLQRCWQFTATERPTFTNIVTDLKDMAEKPNKHIILEVATETGYISDTGQVFLHPLPPYIDVTPSKATKKNWRVSGTQQSIISSIDDTVYTRETAETLVDYTQSENEGRDNYDSYLKGELLPWQRGETTTSSSEEGEDTSTLRDSKGTRVWVESAGSKVYVETTPLASNKESKTKGVATKKKKNKRGKEKAPNKTVMTTNEPVENVKLSEVGVVNDLRAGHIRESSGSSHEPPSVTEEETNGVARGDTSDLSDSSKLLSRSNYE